MPHPNILDGSRAALLIVDVQEAFRGAIPDFALVASNISRVVRGFSILDLTVLVTEQYPQGLGRTAEEIMLALPETVRIFEKTSFSAFESIGAPENLRSAGINQVVLCGFETHICVNQTAHDLIAAGIAVHLLTDCTASRYDADKVVGLNKMTAAGAVWASAETALFEIMRSSRHSVFKEIQNLIK